jgi:hypothetical protein
MGNDRGGRDGRRFQAGRPSTSPSPAGTPATGAPPPPPCVREMWGGRIEWSRVSRGHPAVGGFCTCDLDGRPSDCRSATMDDCEHPGANGPPFGPGGKTERAASAACLLVAGPRAHADTGIRLQAVFPRVPERNGSAQYVL